MVTAQGGNRLWFPEPVGCRIILVRVGSFLSLLRVWCQVHSFTLGPIRGRLAFRTVKNQAGTVNTAMSTTSRTLLHAGQKEDSHEEQIVNLAASHPAKTTPPHASRDHRKLNQHHPQTHTTLPTPALKTPPPQTRTLVNTPTKTSPLAASLNKQKHARNHCVL